MAKRPVFIPISSEPFVKRELVTFEWFPGHAVSQKQRSIAALHEAIRRTLGVDRILEVSTKSTDSLGASLSAFRLRFFSDPLGSSLSVEAAFQGSKVFRDSGQHEELYGLDDGREIKARIRALGDEPIESFCFEGRTWATRPTTAFYDWLYIRAVQDQVNNEELRSGESALHQELVRYEAFTDIEFNPERSLNCQASSCALYVSLTRQGLLGAIRDPDEYLSLLSADVPPGLDDGEERRLFE